MCACVWSGCADEPEDMLHHGHQLPGNKAAEPQREAALATGTDGKKGAKQRSVHFSGDGKAAVCSTTLCGICTCSLQDRQLTSCVCCAEAGILVKV